MQKRTLAYYEHNAESFWQGTRDHDVSQNIQALVGALDARSGAKAPPFRILDFGCGPGRDLAAIKALGHEAVGLDGCERFVAMARTFSGCEVLHQDFLALSLPPGHFDGIFANASLFHIPSEDLPRVLGELRAALRPSGVLVCSNPRGDDVEGWSGDRYSCFFEIDRWRALFTGTGFVERGHYYRPTGKPLAQQPWLVMIWQSR
jgi:SAM-dependent methyltransferase